MHDHDSIRPAPPIPRPTGLARLEGLAVAGLYFAVTCFVTWPTIQDLGATLPFSVRRFDGYGALWFGEHAWRFVQGEVPAFRAPEVAWPLGLDLRLADSFLFGLLYLPFRALLPPVEAFNAFTLAAIASTALSGWWLARRVLGVGALAATAAGFVVGFTSLVHSFRLEGEAYLLAGGFLPLFAGFLLRTAWYGRTWDGVACCALLAALAWSTGYFGINGALVGGVLGALALALGHSRSSVAFGARVRAAAIAVLTALLFLVPLVLLLRSGGGADAIASRFPEGEDPLRNVAQDSVTLSGLLVPFPGSAPLRQDRIFYIGLAGLVVSAAALVLRGPRVVAPWVGLLVVALTLALGPYLRLGDADVGGPVMPYAWVASVAPQILAYRMPARLLSVVALALAGLTALALEGMRRDGLGKGWRVAICGLLAIDGVWFTGAALDSVGAPARVPEAYQAARAPGAIFDFFGTDRLLLRYSGRSVFYQVSHGRPVFADFTRTDGRMVRVSQRLGEALVARDEREVGAVLDALAAVGAAYVAWHRTSFPEPDRAAIREGLVRRMGPPLDAPEDTSGDPVDLFALPDPPAGMDEEAALDVLDGEEVR